HPRARPRTSIAPASPWRRSSDRTGPSVGRRAVPDQPPPPAARSTDPGAVLTMVRNLRPDAVEDVDGAIELGDGLRLEPDPSPRGAGRWTLQTPRVREDPLPEGMGDSHGYGRAFPEGMPFGIERAGLDLA